MWRTFDALYRPVSREGEPQWILLLKFAPPKSCRRRSVAWSATLLWIPAHYTSLRRTASCISKQLSGQFPPPVLAIIQKISGGKTIKPIVTAKALCRVLLSSPGNGDLAGNSTRGSFSGSLLLRVCVPRYHSVLRLTFSFVTTQRRSTRSHPRRTVPSKLINGKQLPIFKILDPGVLSRRVGNTRQAGATAHGWASALRRQ